MSHTFISMSFSTGESKSKAVEFSLRPILFFQLYTQLFSFELQGPFNFSLSITLALAFIICVPV